MRDQFCCGRLPCQTYVLVYKQLQTSRLNMVRVCLGCRMSYFILRVFQTECYLAIVDRGFLQVVMPPKKRIQSFYETAVGEGDVGGGS